MFIGLNAARSSEVTLRWMRAQIFLTLHTAGLGGIISFVAKPPPYQYLPLILTGITVGFILGIAWWGATHRANKWIRFWNARLTQLEQTGDRPPITAYSDPEFIRIDEGQGFFGMTFHGILVVLSALSVLAWLGVGITIFFRIYLGI